MKPYWIILLFTLSRCLGCQPAFAAGPSLAWQLHLTDFAAMTSDPEKSGRVSVPLIEKDRFWLIEPEGSTTTANFLTPAVVTVRETATGKELKRFTSPITRSTFQVSNAGSQDTDLVAGAFWNFVPGGLILAATGGDFPGRWAFDKETGEAKAISGFVNTVIGSGTNCATAFTSHADVPIIISGGNNNHSHISANGGIHDLRGAGRCVPWVGFKQWNIGLIDPETQAAYRLDDTARTTASAFGFRLWGLSTAHGGVGCEVPGLIPFNSFGNDGRGNPRPAAINDQSVIGVLCSKAVGNAGFISKWSVNDYSETKLVLIGQTPNGKTGIIAGFTSWKQLPILHTVALDPWQSAVNCPQLIATPTGFVGLLNATDYTSQKIFRVESDGRIVWQKNIVKQFPVVYQLYRANNFPRHANPSIQMFDGKLYIIGADRSSLHVRSIAYETGELVQDSVLPLGLPKTPDANLTTLQAAQVVPGGVLCSVLYRSGGRTHQSLALLTENQPPPVVPTTPTPEQEVLDFAKPRLTPEKYSAIEKVLQ